jgi:hypothetical protein
MKRSPRTPAKLPESTHQRLSMYALAANAAGVGMLALAQPAEARIIYTSANIPIPQNSLPVPIDLNHDGTPDFLLSNFYIFSTRGLPSLGILFVKQAQQANEIWDVVSSGLECAAALPKGKLIGPKGVFHRDPASGLRMANFSFGGSACPWSKVKQAFVGLKFVVKGKTHFGWARVKLSHQAFSISATLTGYAYETIPNRPIIAGKTRGRDEVDLDATTAATSPAKPATLGALAMGAPRRSIWRRKESVLSAAAGN